MHFQLTHPTDLDVPFLAVFVVFVPRTAISANARRTARVIIVEITISYDSIRMTRTNQGKESEEREKEAFHHDDVLWFFDLKIFNCKQ